MLAALSSFAAQTPGRELVLKVSNLRAVTEEDGRALAQLLATCGDWSVVSLYLLGQVGQEAWKGLSGATSRGKLCSEGHGIWEVHMDREVLRRGAREDLRGPGGTALGTRAGGWWTGRLCTERRGMRAGAGSRCGAIGRRGRVRSELGIGDKINCVKNSSVLSVSVIRNDSFLATQN